MEREGMYRALFSCCGFLTLFFHLEIGFTFGAFCYYWTASQFNSTYEELASLERSRVFWGILFSGLIYFFYFNLLSHYQQLKKSPSPMQV